MPENRFHWKHFLSLGEQLLKQEDSLAQCRFIETTVSRDTPCRARVWLAEPHFPLPGEKNTPPLFDKFVPQIAISSFEKQLPFCIVFGSPSPQVFSGQPGVIEVAFPLLTQDLCLGTLFAQSKTKDGFSKTELFYLERVAAHAALAMQVSGNIAIKKWRAEQISLLRTISGQITQVLDIDQLFQKATRLIQESYGYFRVSIFTFEETQRHLVLRSCSVSDSSVPPPVGLTISPGEGLVGKAALEGCELLTRVPEQSLANQQNSTNHPELSEAALPLKIEDRVVGVLNIHSIRHAAFNDTDLLVLRSLADNIAMAVEESHVFADLEMRAQQVSAILEISHKLNSILQLDVLLQEVVQVIHERFGYPFVRIYTVHSKRRLIIFETSSQTPDQAPGDQPPFFLLDDQDGVIPWVARSNQPRLSSSLPSDPQHSRSEPPLTNIGSELAVPLSYMNDVVGVLDIQSPEPDAFSQNNVELLEGLAAGIAIAIRNASLFKNEQWQRQVSLSLTEVAGLVSANTALEQLLDTILNQLERNLQCEISAIWLYDDVDPSSNSELLRLAAIHGSSPQLVTAAVKRQPQIKTWLEGVFDLSSPGIRQPFQPYGPLGTAMAYPQDYSAIAIPLRSGDKKLGILELAHRYPNLYGTDTGSLVATFASYAAVSIHNARLYAEAQQQAWASRSLLQVAEASHTAEATDDLFTILVHIIPQLVGVNHCAFFSWDETRMVFETRDSFGFEKGSIPGVLSISDHSAFARLYQDKEPQQLNKTSIELIFPGITKSTEEFAYMLLPLVVRSKLVGAFLASLQVTSQAGSEVIQRNQTLSVLQGIAHQVATAFENLRLAEYSRQESYVSAAMLQVSQAVSTHNNLEDTLNSIANLMPILVGVDVCAIYRWKADTRTHYPLQVHSVSEMISAELLHRPLPWGEAHLMDIAFETNTPYYCPLVLDADQVKLFPELDCLPIDHDFHRDHDAKNGWALAFPISSQDQKYGILLVHEVGIPEKHQARRIEIITGVAQQIALAMDNENLKVRMLERERIQREIELARQIQINFLPEQLLKISGWDFNIRWQMAREVGGDFYDIFPLDGCHIGLVVADVSDKGMPAALYMTVTRMLLRAYARDRLSPASVLKKVNEILIGDTRGGMFVTAVYAILCTEDGSLTYANAGHNRPIIIQSGQKGLKILPQGEAAMGVVENVQYKDHYFTINPSESLFLYTDGVTETFSPGMESFGEGRLHQALQSIRSTNSASLLNQIDLILGNFRGDAPLSDDLTILCAHRKRYGQKKIASQDEWNNTQE